MSAAPMDGHKFRAAFVLLLVGGISALFLAVVWPFVKALLLGALLAGLCRPVFRRITFLFGGRQALAAMATIALLTGAILIPFSAFTALVFKQAIEVSDQIIPWLQDRFGDAEQFNVSAWLIDNFPALKNFIPSQQDIIESAKPDSQNGWLVDAASAITAGTFGILLNFFVMLYAIFFFLRDGEKVLKKIFWYMPLETEDEARMLNRFLSITRATIKGTVLVGIIQGALAAAGLYFAGIKGVAFWAAIMMVLSVLPGVGSAIVWVPAVIYLYASGSTFAATALAIWGLAVVGTIDNVLRPILIGRDAKMPDLLILIGTLGGLYLFGPIGFVLGPIACGLFLTAWDIFGETFKKLLPPVEVTSLRNAAKDAKSGKSVGDTEKSKSSADDSSEAK